MTHTALPALAIVDFLPLIVPQCMARRLHFSWPRRGPPGASGRACTLLRSG